MKTRLSIVAGLISCLLTTAAQSQTVLPSDIISTTGIYRQSDAVLSRYRDIPVPLKSPFFLNARTDFTDHAAMMQFLRETAAASNGRMALLSAGQSQQGRDIPMLLLTAEGDATLAAASRHKDRPVIWFLGLQHGNEPAGGESMLALAAEFAQPDMQALLQKVTIVIVPRVNPDGAERFQRNTANGSDPNRDHLLLFLPETRRLHGAMRQLQPDVVFDHHEFSVANRWLEKYGMLQAADALLLQATNPMVSKGISTLAEQLYRPAVDAALARHNLSSFWYYTTSTRQSDKVVSMGGNNPGIARNAMGLGGAVSFLIETRGVGIGMEGWQRRVATHLIAARAVIDATANGGQALKETITRERAAVAAASDDLVVASRIVAKPRDIPLLDPVTGETKTVSVPFQDSRIIEPTQTRARAAGYLVTGATDNMKERLRLKGVVLCQIPSGTKLNVDSYALVEVPAVAGRENINPDQALRATVSSREMTLPSDTLYIPMAQTAAGIVASTMEPDSPGSYLATGVVPLAQGTSEAPVFRVQRGQVLEARGLEASDRAVCGG
ncbi:MAG: M14 family metallopeptidase [Beijerinckiaceae bacterium]